MARFKPYSYNQKLMVPIDLNEQLQPGTFEFALNQIVDDLDLSVFEHRFRNDETGAPAYDPVIMLKIVLFAYSRGITSSRQIARACRENIVFMALAADSHPHFTTIADFISSMVQEITPLFRNVLLICSREGLIGQQMFAIDGCKISSNCAKEWSGTRADFERRSDRIERSINFLLQKHRQTDHQQAKTEDDDNDPSGPTGTQRRKEEQAIKRLRAHKEKFDSWLAENDDKRGSSGNIIQSNITDNESAKMPGSHGVVQGYNGVAAVDSRHQVIVDAQAFGTGSEKRLLEPMLTGLRENLRAMGQTDDPLSKAVLVADNGYHSEANARLVFEQGLDAYLPDPHFRKRNPALAGSERHRRSIDRKKTLPGRKHFRLEDFHYDEAKGRMICPTGTEMYIRNRNFWTAQGRHGITYMAKQTECRVCGQRKRCLRRDSTVARQVTVFEGVGPKKAKSYTQRMIERFDTPRGQFLYSRRMGIVEPVFANVCHAIGLGGFSLRGRVKVDTQWKLFAMVHNLMKLARNGPRYAMA